MKPNSEMNNVWTRSQAVGARALCGVRATPPTISRLPANPGMTMGSR